MTHDTLIDDPVKVWAFFDPSTDSASRSTLRDEPSGSDSRSSLQASSGQARIFPIAMSWNRRFIKFERLIFMSSKMRGSTRLVDLVCASNTSNFELEYNTHDYSWRVKKVMSKD